MRTPHLNPCKCEIRWTETKGRGIFATQLIPAQTTIEISPVMLFSKAEYEEHGRHTIIDHYTFKWRDGRMALALGLGSIFNHSSNPNVTYELDNAHACIRYTTTRVIQPDEELCIYYGHSLWFEAAESSPTTNLVENRTPQAEAFNLAGLENIDIRIEQPRLYLEEELPFERVNIKEEEDDNEVETVDAWVVDIPNVNGIAELISWLKESDLQHPSLKHAKHIRRLKHNGSSIITLLLTAAEAIPPSVPGNLIPYVTKIPRFPARTLEQAKIKSTIWPVVYEAQNHRELREESQRWTKETVQWFRDAINVINTEAKRVHALGELPIVSYVPSEGSSETRSFIAFDTRRSTQSPLAHSIFNLVRSIGELRPVPEPSTSTENGHNYLLTSRTLFTTHEPCVSCSMALVHSRVKEIVYIYPMLQTGGCGGIACIPALKNINHRFKIWKWRGFEHSTGGIDPWIDA